MVNGIGEGLGRWFTRRGFTGVHELRWWDSVAVGPLEITMTPARHWSKRGVFDTNRSLWGGFVVEGGGAAVYHAGDTGVFADMAFIGSYYQPHLALLPIGGHYTMDPAHAAYAVRELLKTPTVVPMHYGTFPPLKGTPGQFKEALGDYGGDVVVMEPGETRTF